MVHHRLAAVWFADIVEYSQLSARNEVQALALVRAFQDAARDTVERFGGRVVKFLGDGALAEFASAAAAVGSAGALRAAFGGACDRAGLGDRCLRIGVHIGEVAVDGDGDLYGDGVNVAERVRQEAEPGEIVATEDVYRQLRQWPDFEFDALGERKLKGGGRHRIYRVRVGGDVTPESVGEADAAPPTGGLAALVAELGRRHVFRVAGLYLVAAWIGVQVAAVTFPPLHLPGWSLTLVVVLALAGFPIVVLLAWAYEKTPHGVRRTTGSTAGIDGRWWLAAGAAVVAVMALGWGLLRWAPWSRSGEVPAVAASSVALDPARLAILYFEDRSPAGDLAHVASGITEALIDELDRVAELEVVSRYGVRGFQDGEVPMDSIALRLGAGTLVDGSVERVGDRLEIQVRLVDAATMTQIESFTEEQPEGEVFTLIDGVARELAMLLRQRLGRELRMAERRRSTESVAAWELVQRAERLREQWAGVEGDILIVDHLRFKADSLLQRAESLDPGWVAPSLLRAEIVAGSGGESALRRAIEQVDGVLADHAGDARALTQRGVYQRRLALSSRDSSTVAVRLRAAERDLRAAVASDPTQASAWIALAELLHSDKGEWVEARRVAELAYEADAFLLEEEHFRYLCEISIQLEDSAAARRWCEEGRRRFPNRAYLIQTEILRLASPGVEPDPSRSWALVDEISRLIHADYNVPSAQMYVAMGLARAGLADSAEAVVTRVRQQTDLFEKYPELVPSFDYLEGFVRFLLDQRTPALSLFRSACEGNPEFRALLARDRWLDPLAGDAAFEAIADRNRWPIFCRLLCKPPG